MHRSMSYRPARPRSRERADCCPSRGVRSDQTQVVVSGVGYAQYVYQLKDTANHNNNFNVTRAYMNLIGKFAGGVGARVTLDVNRPPATTRSRYRLKYAFATYTPTGSALTFKIGMIHTPLARLGRGAVGLPDAGHHARWSAAAT